MSRYRIAIIGSASLQFQRLQLVQSLAGIQPPPFPTAPYPSQIFCQDGRTYSDIASLAHTPTIFPANQPQNITYAFRQKNVVQVCLGSSEICPVEYAVGTGAVSPIHRITPLSTHENWALCSVVHREVQTASEKEPDYVIVEHRQVQPSDVEWCVPPPDYVLSASEAEHTSFVTAVVHCDQAEINLDTLERQPREFWLRFFGWKRFDNLPFLTIVGISQGVHFEPRPSAHQTNHLFAQLKGWLLKKFSQVVVECRDYCPLTMGEPWMQRVWTTSISTDHGEVYHQQSMHIKNMLVDIHRCKSLCSTIIQHSLDASCIYTLCQKSTSTISGAAWISGMSHLPRGALDLLLYKQGSVVTGLQESHQAILGTLAADTQLVSVSDTSSKTDQDADTLARLVQNIDLSKPTVTFRGSDEVIPVWTRCTAKPRLQPLKSMSVCKKIPGGTVFMTRGPDQVSDFEFSSTQVASASIALVRRLSDSTILSTDSSPAAKGKRLRSPSPLTNQRDNNQKQKRQKKQKSKVNSKQDYALFLKSCKPLDTM